MKKPALSLLALLSITLLTGAATELVDPTRPPADMLPPIQNFKVKGPLQVTAIFIYPSYRTAIINGQLVRVGDQLGSHTIINIQRDTVELSGAENKTMVLNLVTDVKSASTTKGL
jgi:MSHA biogenesis protein MshK